ncbi:MAG TPA: nitrous oxide reductase accessory protein NosL [Chitinophagaceae bacterium]
MKKMNNASRIIVAAASLAMIATFFLPVWAIYLVAPQYPEGLSMQIWLNQITGQVEIINGLNHYIGMKHISADMFPEFGFLTYIVGAFIALGLLVALIGNRKFLFAYLILLGLGGAAALADFYKWGYDYGHNLDPKAAIQVPGFSYQPPLIGHKQLLNFDAYSYPDTGGWVVVIAGLLFFGVWLWEKRRAGKQTVVKKTYRKEAVLASVAALTLASCSVEPQPITIGKDACNECRMTIMDPKFGGEVITKKGKVFLFDDAHCLVQFYKSGKIQEADVAQTVMLDHAGEAKFLDVKTAHFVVSPSLKSPMNSNAAAFASKAEADSKATEVAGKVLDWDALYNAL